MQKHCFTISRTTRNQRKEIFTRTIVIIGQIELEQFGGWNITNRYFDTLCGSARPREGEPSEGVFAYGAEVIREMNRLGVMVDLSHASERSFFDALDIYTQTTLINSHLKTIQRKISILRAENLGEYAKKDTNPNTEEHHD